MSRQCHAHEVGTIITQTFPVECHAPDVVFITVDEALSTLDRTSSIVSGEKYM